MNAQRTVAGRVERVNQGRQPGPNVLRLRRIGETLARIQAAATRSCRLEPAGISLTARLSHTGKD